jgi:hypothetical protein
MAKTFGTGADPKGLVNRGVEGSGAAQIFRPSQAAQDFVTRQARGEQQKAAQKRADVKIKAEKQKVDQKAIQDLLDVDLIGWNEKRNSQLLADFNLIQDEAAQLIARGENLSQSKELLTKKKILEQKVDLMKLERTEYSNAVKTLAQIAKNPNYDPGELTSFADRIALFEQGGIGENDFSLLTPPAERKPIDWMKGIDRLVNNTKLELVQIEDGDITTTTEKVTKENIENRWKLFEKTKEYKAAIEDGVTPQEAKSAFISNLPSKYRRLYDEDSGGVTVNYGGGNITSGGIKAIYAPNAYNVFKTQIEGLESIFTQTERNEINPDGAILFNPVKLAEIPPIEIATQTSGDPITFRINAIFKKNNGQYVAAGTRVYYTQDGQKRQQPTRLIISGQNKEEIEDRYLGGITIEEAFENFKANRKPKSTTAPVAPKTPSTAPSKAPRPK